MRGPAITLLTDFGTADGYVAEMKGVLTSLAPDSAILDASHEVLPQDVQGARLALARYWRHFPVGTVHVVVVDPSVGTSRAALAVESDGRYLVGPDNGVLSPALVWPGARVVSLAIPADAAHTFHGRDVFAPAAARLASGDMLDALGARFSDAHVERTPLAHQRDDGSLEGRVITIDRFGNAITNFVARNGVVEVAGWRLPVVQTYAEVEPGEPCAVAGSAGLLEIAVRNGSAAAVLRLSRETPLLWHPVR